MRVGEGCLIVMTFIVFHPVHLFEFVLGFLIIEWPPLTNKLFHNSLALQSCQDKQMNKLQ